MYYVREVERDKEEAAEGQKLMVRTTDEGGEHNSRRKETDCSGEM
jgi:hypothetical protein